MIIRTLRLLCFPPRQRKVQAAQILLVFLLLAQFQPLKAQTTAPDRSILQTFADDFLTVWGDARYLLGSPARNATYTWPYWIAGAGGAASLTCFDEGARDIAHRNPPSGFTQSLLNVTREYGSIITMGVTTTGIYAIGLLGGSSRIRTTGRMLAEGLAFTGVMRLAIGFAAGRRRPSDGISPWTIRPLGWSDARRSFPSGHSAFAFTISTILADRISLPGLTPLLYGTAMLTGISRISDDEHWLSDVCAGAVLGTLVGLYVVEREEHRENADTQTLRRIHLVPAVDRISLVLDF